MKTLSYSESIDTLNEVFEEKGRIVFPRFGDVDFIMMTKTSGTIGRSNQNVCNDETKKLLTDAFTIDGEDVIVGTMINIQGAPAIGNNIPKKVLSEQGVFKLKKNPFVAATALERMFLNKDNRFIDFFSKLKNKNYLFVGNYYEKALDRFYGYNVGHVNTPMRNSINDNGLIIQELTDLIEKTATNTVILSCGQLARVICKRLHNKFPNTNFIDVGSVSDMIIVNTDSFEKIPKRTHIECNLNKIKNNLQYYESRINNNNS